MLAPPPTKESVLVPNDGSDRDMPKPDRKALIPRLFESGPRAPQVLAQAAVESVAGGAAGYAYRVSGHDDVEELVVRVIASHRTLARAEGMGAGVAVSFAEMTTVFGTAGTLTLPAAAVTLMGDIVGLAWIQVRMVLIIAALHGHDPRHPDRLQELLTLTGAYGAGPAGAAGKAAADGEQRVACRSSSRCGTRSRRPVTGSPDCSRRCAATAPRP